MRVLIVVLASALAACGRASPPPPGSSPAGGVGVALTEFSLVAEPAEVPAGPVTITARNDGNVPHEVVVIASRDVEGLPVAGGVVDEERLTVLGEIEHLPASVQRSVTIDLEPGSYALICNIAGHYQAGMWGALRVA